MSETQTWHVPEGAIAAYLAGATDEVQTCSMEAHVLACPTCQAAVAASTRAADGPTAPAASAFEEMWASIVDELDAPHRTWLERVAVRVGVSASTARLLSATRALRLAFASSVAAAVALTILCSKATESDPSAFLVLGPLVPLIAIGTSFGSIGDPTYEVTLAAPIDKVRLFALRASIVMTGALVALLIGALTVPGLGSAELLWLLPSAALVAVTLGLATWTKAATAAPTVAVVWLLSVFLLAEGHDLRRIADHCAVYRPSGQLLAALVTAVGLVVTAHRRDAFDLVVGR